MLDYNCQKNYSFHIHFTHEKTYIWQYRDSYQVLEILKVLRVGVKLLQAENNSAGKKWTHLDKNAHMDKKQNITNSTQEGHGNS